MDVAFGDYADMFYAQAQAQAKANKGKSSLNLVVVADGYDAVANTMEVLALPGSGIVTPKNLVGKTVGTAPAEVMPSNVQGMPYSLETVATQSVLSNDNVKPSSTTWQPVAAATVADPRAGEPSGGRDPGHRAHHLRGGVAAGRGPGA
jgi:ABC-type nitrate/sulfonate/bicarbonate transport system substrate-binding protein